MFTIGQFAQLGQVSVRTLRHYDDHQLLVPAAIDANNGYRQYTAEQLADLNRVLALKDMGLRLAEIRGITESGISNEELVGMLRLRQAEAQRSAEIEAERLKRAAVRIHLLDEPTQQDVHAAVVVKPLASMRVATVVEPIDDFDRNFMEVLPPLFQALYDETVRLGIRKPVGPIMSLFPARDDGRIDMMAAVPIEPDEEFESEVVKIIDLAPVARAATTVYTGHPKNGHSHLRLLQKWLELNEETGYYQYREIYLTDAQGDPETWVTEMQCLLGP